VPAVDVSNHGESGGVAYGGYRVRWSGGVGGRHQFSSQRPVLRKPAGEEAGQSRIAAGVEEAAAEEAAVGVGGGGSGRCRARASSEGGK
jgi:hypothetical protein